MKFHANPSSGSRLVPCGKNQRWTDTNDEANIRFLKVCKRLKQENNINIEARGGDPKIPGIVKKII